jgi:hypothetical protein
MPRSTDLSRFFDPVSADYGARPRISRDRRRNDGGHACGGRYFSGRIRTLHWLRQQRCRCDAIRECGCSAQMLAPGGRLGAPSRAEVETLLRECSSASARDYRATGSCGAHDVKATTADQRAAPRARSVVPQTPAVASFRAWQKVRRALRARSANARCRGA